MSYHELTDAQRETILQRNFNLIYTDAERKTHGSNRWLDMEYWSSKCIFYRWTFRQLLNRLFDRHATIYRTVEQRTSQTNGTIVAATARTTLLLSIVDRLSSCVDLALVFRYFLYFRSDINFFHPSPNNNTLLRLQRHKLILTRPDITMLLLRRKELQQIPHLKYFYTQVGGRRDILDTIIGIYDKCNGDVIVRNFMFAIMLEQYLKDNKVYSRVLFLRLLARSTLDSCALFDQLYRMEANRLDLICHVPWATLENYDAAWLSSSLGELFSMPPVVEKCAHTLLEFYRRGLVSLREAFIPPAIVKYTLQHFNYGPEHLILFEWLHVLDNARHLLPDGCPVLRYLDKRRRRRYCKYVAFWRHKTYSPGSKVFQKLYSHYSSVMPHNPSSTMVDDIKLDMKQFANIM